MSLVSSRLSALLGDQFANFIELAGLGLGEQQSEPPGRPHLPAFRARLEELELAEVLGQGALLRPDHEAERVFEEQGGSGASLPPRVR